jgi:hypothetical protein
MTDKAIQIAVGKLCGDLPGDFDDYLNDIRVMLRIFAATPDKAAYIDALWEELSWGGDFKVARQHWNYDNVSKLFQATARQHCIAYLVANKAWEE